MAFDLLDEFSAILAKLSAERIEHAVCGGIAVVLHGYVRATRDIDLLILPEDLDRTREAVRQIGFSVEVGPLTFGAGTDRERRVFRTSKVRGADLLTLDLMLVTPVLRKAWETRGTFSWRGREICAVSRAGLGLMKRLAGRRQDLADLEHLGIDDAEE